MLNFLKHTNNSTQVNQSWKVNFSFVMNFKATFFNFADVVLISKSKKLYIDSFALALSSDFFRKILETETQRDLTSIIIPDIDIEILEKVRIADLKIVW